MVIGRRIFDRKIIYWNNGRLLGGWVSEYSYLSHFYFRTSIRALLVLLPIFGMTWIIGIFGFTSDAVPVMYIFVILNSSQGVLIFIFHCLWNTEVIYVAELYIKKIKL